MTSSDLDRIKGPVPRDTLDRLCAPALIFFPSRFRRRHGRELLRLHRELYPAGSRWQVVRFLTRFYLDALTSGVGARIDLARTAITGTRLRGAVPSSGGNALGTFFHHLRRTLRTLRRSPGFAASVILTLALGIGANTAVFSVVHAVLIRPLPYEEPGRLYQLMHRGRVEERAGSGAVTRGNFYRWQQEAEVFEAMAGWGTVRYAIPTPQGPATFTGVGSAGSIFDVLEVPPLVGRTFRADADRPGQADVVVLSYTLWRRLYGEDRGAVGSTLELDGTPHTVIGVMPPDFRFPDTSALFWTPYGHDASERADQTQYYLTVLARLAPGTTLEQAGAEMESIMIGLREERPEANENVEVSITPLKESFTAGVSTRLLVLLAAVALVLLLACANLANLMLARVASRRRELAVHRALGAGRGGTSAMIVLESTTLALIGGAAAVFTGWGLQRVLVTLAPDGIPRIQEAGLHAPVLLFTLGVSLVVGLLFGVVPALRTSRDDPAEVLRGEGGASSRSTRTRSVLVGLQAAVAVILMAGAGLLLRSLVLLHHVDPVVRSEQMLTFEVQLPWDRYPDLPGRIAFFEETAEELEALPGVRAASYTSWLPFAGRGIGAWVNIMDRPAPEGTTPPAEAYRVVASDYFETAGIPLVRGRYPTPEDTYRQHPALLVNEAMARAYWPGEDPLGKELVLGVLGEQELNPPAPIVGIVRDVPARGIGTEPIPIVYLPYRVMPFWSRFAFVLRTEVPPVSVAGAAREVLQRRDPSLPVDAMAPLTDLVEAGRAPTRSTLVLVGLFAAVALGLMAVGLYGVLAYMVGRRERELAIRSALGAGRGRIRGMVLREGMMQAGVGAMVGLAAALALTRLMSSLLYGISPTDPLTLASVLLLLGLVAAAASWVPAARATRMEPMLVLREE